MVIGTLAFMRCQGHGVKHRWRLFDVNAGIFPAGYYLPGKNVVGFWRMKWCVFCSWTAIATVGGPTRREHVNDIWRA